MNAPMTPAQKQQMEFQRQMDQNALNRGVVLSRSINRWSQIYQQTLTGTLLGQVVNVPLRNTGLVKRLIVEITGTIAQAAAETLTRTALGPANILSNVVLTDMNNQTRINTAGWHLHAVASAKRGWAFGAAYTNDSPIGYGSNFNVISFPASVTTAQNFRMFYEIPVSMGDLDLRGAIWANVVSATFNLQMTINPNFVVATATNPTLAVLRSSSADLGTLSNVVVTVYQNYLDQLPQTPQGTVLPALDIGTAYLLNNTVVSGIVVNQDITIPFANFRDFYSTFLIYDNFGYSTAVGGDMTRLGMRSANYTDIFAYDPFMSSLLARSVNKDDLPSIAGQGMYMVDTRSRPVNTLQFGNMEIYFNPSDVQGATSQMLVGYEQSAYINQITQAGSLYNT